MNIHDQENLYTWNNYRFLRIPDSYDAKKVMVLRTICNLWTHPTWPELQARMSRRRKFLHHKYQVSLSVWIISRHKIQTSSFLKPTQPSKSEICLDLKICTNNWTIPKFWTPLQST